MFFFCRSVDELYQMNICYIWEIVLEVKNNNLFSGCGQEKGIQLEF